MSDLLSLGSFWSHLSHLNMISVVWLLRAGWVACTLPIAIASIPSRKLNSFRDMLLGFSKRGKIMQASSKKFTVPQRLFCHFYILAVIWTTVLLVATWHYAYTTVPSVSEPSMYASIASHLTGLSHEFSLHKSRTSLREHTYSVWKSVFLLLLMEAQVLRRLIESIYVFHYSPSARMHIFGYITGIGFYTAAPLSLCCAHTPEIFHHIISLFAEFVVKGKARMQESEMDIWGCMAPLLRLKWYAWIGAAIFAWGWIHQHTCHAILGSLRENGVKGDEYVIPRGDWFEYVSSPHYLAEIVIYGGLVVASGFTDITIWLLFAFVVANLTITAVETHLWYIRKFENYPKNRRAIIPFVL